ncbi:MAG: 30S ribosomal protein S21 [Candidatus Shikimatogenerans sp. Tduv]|uniref:Small ribosomal subunit protein bS21 n=1 Tax=Candidatus Shikimatogenerans sp. Tduv TaxID=3158567 RepID=A0AAU7QRW3_9FLAO
MIYIKINKKDNINKILKIYKSKIKKINLIKEFKKRQFFIKKSIKKKNQLNKAKYLLKIKKNE